MSENHYQVLGINQDASESEVRKSYRSLSLKYHPDRNPSEEAGELFRKINEANEVLSDPEKRKQYDHDLKYGEGSFMQQSEMNDINNIINQMFGGGMGMGGFPGFPGFPGMGGIRVNMGGMNMGGFPGGMHNVRVFHNGQEVNVGDQDPFSQFFSHMQKPEPLIKHVTISLEDAYKGMNLPVEIEKVSVLRRIQSTEIETIYVDIPQGMNSGDTLLLPNMGNSVEGNSGDLKIVLQIENTTKFVRNGLDLHYQVPISLKDALCGFSLEIKHLNGKVLSLNNKENNTVIKPNHKKTVPNLGMVKGENTGNLVIEFLVEFPEELNREQIDRLREIL
jgi:DnaJ family protein B protein 4